MKWIVLLRNPIDRAYSHWNMAQRRGMEDETGFLDAVYHERRRARESLPRQHKRLSFVDRGFYSDQLRRIWFFFPREQTLILKSEEFRVSRHTALDKVCRFLGAEPFPRDYPVEESVSKYEPMGEDARALLAGVFEHEIHEVERLLGWDCSDWLS